MIGSSEDQMDHLVSQRVSEQGPAVHLEAWRGGADAINQQGSEHAAAYSRIDMGISEHVVVKSAARCP